MMTLKRKKIDHELSFECYSKRLSCFEHALPLVIQAFSRDATFKPLLKKVHCMVAKVNKSSKATEALIALACKKLVQQCPTRWSSVYLMLERLNLKLL